MSGDVLPDRAMLWARADRPARMLIEVADNPDFRAARQLPWVDVLPDSGLIGKLDATGLGGMPEVHYRVRFAALGDARAVSEPVVGPPAPAAERTAGSALRVVRRRGRSGLGHR